MKNLKDFEKDLGKCSKCGLCESVCPLYKLVPNDCIASKGKFIMLHGVTKGDLKLSKNIDRYIDLCLKCGKCMEFCPSDIDVCQILSAAKADYLRGRFYSGFVKFFQSRLIFRSFIKIGQILSAPFRPKHSKKGKKTVVYFKGCVNQIFPSTDKFLRRIFNKSVNIIEPDFDCCGLPFLTEGNTERFEQAALSNLKKFSTEADCIVTDCASCESTLLSYPKYVDDASKIKVKTFLNWGDIIAEQDIKFKSPKPIKVTFHKPCHLKSDEFFEKIMENCENVEYIKMENYDSCCGFAGSFALKNPKLSSVITKQKAQQINSVCADYVITTCPSCILGLKQGLMLTGSKTKVVSLLEFLATKCYKI